MRTSAAPAIAWAPAAAATSATVPSIGAVRLCSIFMASITATRAPFFDRLPRHHEHGHDLAVHRRPHHAVVAEMIGIEGVVAHQRDVMLAAAGDDHRPIGEFDHPHRGRRRVAAGAVDRDLRAARAPGDARLPRRAIDHDVDRDGARRPEREAVIGRPRIAPGGRRRRWRRAAGRRNAGALALEQHRDRMGDRLRLDARIGVQELGEMPLDEAGIETAGAEFAVLDERLEKRRVDPRADHDGVAERRRQAIERLAPRSARGR